MWYAMEYQQLLIDGGELKLKLQTPIITLSEVELQCCMALARVLPQELSRSFRASFFSSENVLTVENMFNAGEVYKDLIGSAYYVAPEVLKRHYGPEADIWSAGVILYILLSGVPPFWAENEDGMFNEIRQGHVDFLSDPWPSISSGAKDLVKKMLRQDPKEWLTAAEILNHPWIREDGEAPDKPLDNTVLSRMKQFRAMNKLKKVALKVVAENLSEEEIMGLKEMFKLIDTDNSGTITLEELRTGLPKLGTKISESELMQLMEAAIGLSLELRFHFSGVIRKEDTVGRNNAYDS